MQNRRPRVFQVALDPGPSLFAERYQPGLVALAGHPQHTFVHAELDRLEQHQLGHPQATGIHQLKHGPIAQAERGIHIGCSQQGFDLRLGQRLWITRRLFGRLQAQTGIGTDLVLTQRQLVEALEHCQPAVGRSGLGDFVARGEIGIEIIGLRPIQILAALGMQPGREQLEVAPIGFQRVLCQTVFQPQGVAEFVDHGLARHRLVRLSRHIRQCLRAPAASV